MPNIRTVEAGPLELKPSSIGEAAWREAGAVQTRYGYQEEHMAMVAASAQERGFNAIARGLGSVLDAAQKHDDMLAISQAQMKAADFDLQEHMALDGVASPKPDPNDPTGTRTIQPDVNNAQGMIGERLNSFNDGYQKLIDETTNPRAKEWLMRHHAEAYANFGRKAYTINSELSYIAAGSNIVKSANSYGQIVYNDPTQLDPMLARLKDNVDMLASSTNLKNVEAARFKTETYQKAAKMMVEQAIAGMARNPAGVEVARALVNSGKYSEYIGADTKTLNTWLDGQKTAQLKDIERNRKAAELVIKDNADTTTYKYGQQLTNTNQDDLFTKMRMDPAYKDHPDLLKKGEEYLDTLTKIGNGTLKVPAITDQRTRDQFLATLKTDKPYTLGDLQDAVIKHTLSTESEKYLEGQLKAVTENPNLKPALARLADIEKKYAKFLDPMRTTDPQAGVDKETGLVSGRATALGDINISRWKQAAIKKVQDGIRAGISPEDLFDPNNPKAVNYPAFMKQFATSKADAGEFQRQLDKEAVPALKAAPGHHPDLTDVDPRLVDTLTHAAAMMPPGYQVRIHEGYNPAGHAPHSQHHIKGRGAIDLEIVDPSGKVLANRGDDPGHIYQTLAEHAYSYLNRNYPELHGQLGWGGRFGTVPGGSTRDLMHFDLGGDRGRLYGSVDRPETVPNLEAVAKLPKGTPYRVQLNGLWYRGYAGFSQAEK